MKIPHSRLTAWLVKLNHMTQAEADEYAKLADVPVGPESALTQRLVAAHSLPLAVVTFIFSKG